MRRQRSPRRGLTLLELLVVVTLIGIFAATAAMRFGRTLFAEFGSQGAARELSLALLACQRTAIRTGDDHYVEFLLTGGQVTAYRIMRDAGGVPSLVDGPKDLPSDVTVTPSNSTMRFNFEGAAAASYSIDVTGQDRSWRVEVVPINGALRVLQTG